MRAVGLNQVIIQEGRIINNTRIQYLLVGDKLYQVTHIDFSDLTLEARECDLDVGDVPEDEVFLLEDFEEFKVTLRNGEGRLWILGSGWKGMEIESPNHLRKGEW